MNWLFFLFKYSLHAENFSGTAGRISSFAHSGTQFSTKDRDNDRCTCRCAQLASGGTLPSQSPFICSFESKSYSAFLPSPSQTVHNSIKFLPTDSCWLGCCLSPAWISRFPFNSGSFVLQAGGSKRAAPPISMAYTTPARPAGCATTALSGTTGRAPIWWRPWRPWWCARPISGSVISDEASLPQIKYDRQKKKYIFGEQFSDFFLISIHINIVFIYSIHINIVFLNYILSVMNMIKGINRKQTRLAGIKPLPFNKKKPWTGLSGQLIKTGEEHRNVQKQERKRHTTWWRNYELNLSGSVGPLSSWVPNCWVKL